MRVLRYGGHLLNYTIMKKFLLKFGIIHGDLRRLARKALAVSTSALKILQSAPVTALNILIPGQQDDALKYAIEALLQKFIALFEQAGTDPDKRKYTAMQFASNLVAHMDGVSLGDPSDYLSVTQKVFNANKSEYKVTPTGGSGYAAAANKTTT